ncbi:hypothetical protein A2U01_0103211, partial [Trifolium medium]|nr:hypothetical protein [Trifolium medium]
TGRSLLQGGSTQNLTAGGDAVTQESTEVVAENLEGVFCYESEDGEGSQGAQGG